MPLLAVALIAGIFGTYVVFQGKSASNLEVTPEVVGMPFTKKNEYPRNVWDMQEFNGRIYLGHGNSSNSDPNPNAGPVPIIYLDPATNQFVTQTTISEEQIDNYEIIRGKLTIPGHDPKTTGGSYYTLEANDTWKTAQNNIDALHVYDMAEFNGRIFAGIGLTRASILTNKPVMAENHAGVINVRMLLPHSTTNIFRVHDLINFKGNLYASAGVYGGQPQFNDPSLNLFYKFNEASNNFEQVNIASSKLFPNFPHAPGAGGLLIRMDRPTVFKDSLAYVGAYGENDHQQDPKALYIASEIGQARKITLGNAAAVPYDILVKDNTLYVLAVAKSGNQYVNYVYKTTDTNNWTEVLHFPRDTFARSFEKVGDYFYFGLGANHTEPISQSAGTILRAKAPSQTPTDPSKISFVTDEVKISPADEDNLPHWQTAMAINPENPKNMIVSSELRNGDDTRLYASRDGGLTWERTFQNTWWDPVVAIGPDNMAYLVTINKDQGQTRLYRSSDGGFTWQSAYTVFGFVDKPLITVDNTNNSTRGNVYIAGRTAGGSATLKVFYSIDQGATVKEKVGPVLGSQSSVRSPVVFRDGSLFIPTEYAPINVLNNPYSVPFKGFHANMVNGSLNLSAPFNMFTATIHRYDTVHANTSGYASGLDKQGREVLYAMLPDVTDPTKKPWLKLLKSYDRGVTWEAPMPVVPSGPFGIAHGEFQLMAAPNGVIGVTWLDAVKKLSSFFHYSYDVWFTASDRGDPFLPPVKVSTKTSNPDFNNNGPRPTGMDHMLAAAGNDNVFHAYWPDSRPPGPFSTSAGIGKLLTRAIKVSNGSVAPVPTVTLSANPMSLTGSGNTTLTWSSSNAESCVASGGWSGTKSTSGSELIQSVENTTIFKLICSGDGGTSPQASASVTVTEPIDGVPPTVSIILPKNGDKVSGDSSVFSADAKDEQGGSGIDHVEFMVDGNKIGEDNNFPYSITWDTSVFTHDSNHNLRADAYDKAGNITKSTVARITIDNPPPPDTSLPEVSFVSPVNNATVLGIITTLVNASDNEGIASVDYSVDGTLKLSDTTSPYKYSIDTKTLTNGSHMLTAKAYDLAGNTKTATITVNVQNADTTAPSAPIGLTGSVINSTRVNLSWSASTDSGLNASGVDKYNVLRNGVVVAQVNAPTTSYADTSTAAGTSYSYIVQAVDGAGNISSSSNTATVTMPQAQDEINPSTPANFAASANGPVQINLSWSPSSDTGGSGLAGYNIYRNGSKLNTSGLIAPTATSYGDASVSANTTYSYQVEAVDGAGNKSPKTNAVGIRTPEQKLGDITGGPGSRPDGKINFQDLLYVLLRYQRGENDPKADVTNGTNGSSANKVDFQDLVYLLVRFER